MCTHFTASTVRNPNSLTRIPVPDKVDSIRELTMKLGELVYRLWLQGQEDKASVETIAQEIKNKKQEIAALEARIREVESEKQIILNGTVRDSAKHCCPNCGNPCLPDALFCGSCGFRLKEES